MVVVFLFGLAIGLLVRSKYPRVVYEISQENVRRWLAAMAKQDKAIFLEEHFRHFLLSMDETERSKVLYPFVKGVYNGRRTIHRCPTRKGKSTNLLDNI